MSIIIGIDPGKSGAIAVLDDCCRVEIYDIGGSLVDAVTRLKQLSEVYDITGVVIEKVHSFPKQGVASSFDFGCTYGHLRGACIALGIPIIAEPSPQQWKKAIFGSSISKLDKAGQKRAARDKARELYPLTAPMLARVKDADKAEALLLCVYGARMNRGIV